MVNISEPLKETIEMVPIEKLWEAKDHQNRVKPNTWSSYWQFYCGSFFTTLVSEAHSYSHPSLTQVLVWQLDT